MKTNTMNKSKQVKLNDVDYTFNVVYLREYIDPDDQEFFYAYETIYRNVPYKFKDKFNTKSMKMKILKFCDWNYKEPAVNFQNVTKVELIDQDEYYKTYEQVFGDTAKDDMNMFNDYGQSYDRQSFRKDFNKELTYKLNPIKRKVEQMKGLN